MRITNSMDMSLSKLREIVEDSLPVCLSLNVFVSVSVSVSISV